MENPDAFQDVVSYSAAVGALLPLVISLVKRQHWSTQTKRLVAVVVSLIAAVATVAATEQSLNPELLLASAGTIFALAKTTYDGWWEDTGVETRLAAVMSDNSDDGGH
jgi:hypothetical protein